MNWLTAQGIAQPRIYMMSGLIAQDLVGRPYRLDPDSAANLDQAMSAHAESCGAQLGGPVDGQDGTATDLTPEQVLDLYDELTLGGLQPDPAPLQDLGPEL